MSGPVSGSATNPYLADLWQQAAGSFEAGEHETAENVCQQLIFLAPEKPMAYSLMSRLCHLKGQVRPAALNAFLASRRAAGAHWLDIITISSTLREVGECQLAHEVLSLIDPQEPANRAGLLELARQYSVLLDQSRALHCIELARSLGSNGWFASHILGTVLSFTSPVERAVAACEDSITQNPKCGHAHWSRAQFGLKEGAEQRTSRIRNALAMPGLGNDDVACMQYALFKELDTLDRADEAWPALMAGAKARRSVTEFNVEKENRAFDALIRVASARFLDRCGVTATDVTPIFIVGLPCAGTTMMERILGNHPQIATCGELDDFRQQMQWVNNVRLPVELDGNFGNFVAHLNYSVLGRRYLEKTRWLTEGKTFFSDSQPMNFMLCGPIMRALPHAKIVHLRRHPMDSCFSSLKTLFARGSYPYSYMLDELANHYRNYDRLMRHWHGIAPGRILDVRYEDLLAQPELQAMRAQKYLGLPGIVGITETPANTKVATAASTLQSRQTVDGGKVGGWRRYQQYLAPLQALLAEHIDAYEGPGKAILMSRL
jgi:tetratricopeptide (TPR) repeat protein